MTCPISVVIPALHEAATINRTIGTLVSGGGARPEIIVVDGDPSGDTIRAVTAGEAICTTAPPGRARQMNRGADLSTREILLFLHADTLLPPGGLERIAAAVEKGYRAGAFALGIESDRIVFRVTEHYAALRTTITKIPFGDQAIFMHRGLFRELGGYHDIPIMEDVDLMRRLRSRGARLCLIPEKVLTSPRRWERDGLLFCTARNWALQLSFALGARPERLARWYR